MWKLLKLILLVVLLRLVIGLVISRVLPSFIPPYYLLNLDPLWTALRVLIIAWLVVKIIRTRSRPVGTTIGIVILTLLFIGDFYINSVTHCDEKDTSRDANIHSIVLDFVPFVGDVKGLSEMATGCDSVTGERLETFRWLGIFGIMGIAEIGLAGDVVRLGVNGAEAGIRSIDNIASAGVRGLDDVASIGMRNLDNVARDLGKGLQSAGEGVARWGREAGEAIAKNTDEIAANAGRALNNTDSLVAQSQELRRMGLTFKICSFSGDTLVWSETGPIEISRVVPQHKVLGYNEALDQSGFYTVTSRFIHNDRELVVLWIDGERINTTPEHLFMTSSAGWVPAQNLAQGDRLRSESGRLGEVQAVASVYELTPMYNLEVAEAHTYFVGTQKWLAHNDCWESKAGLVYTKIGESGDRLEHVAQHLVVIPNKKTHTVFTVKSKDELVKLIDEAWLSSRKISKGKASNREVWEIPMNRVIGINGETAIVLIIEDSNEVVTAYPKAIKTNKIQPK